MGTASVREVEERALAKLDERRRRQEQLIDALVDALIARDRATKAVVAVEAAVAEAVTGLAALGGIGRQEIAVLFGVPIRDARGRGIRRVARDAPARSASVPAARPVERGGGAVVSEDGAIRVWLAMIERGPSPKTHALDEDGGLLCRGPADPAHLETWTGYAFDVDCNRCAKQLAEELTEDEFG